MTDPFPIALHEPEFPPLLSGRRVLEGQAVREAAIAGVRGHELGAGDVLWADDPSRVELAIVLEPEVALATAIQMLPLTMCAVGDCIGVLAPPQVGVMFRWPGTLLVNGAAAGEVALDVVDCGEREIPEWMVVAIALRFRHAPGAAEPGHIGADITALAEEGCEELTPAQLIESTARHFLTWLNIWQDDGFRAVHQSWLERVEGRDEIVAVAGRSSLIYNVSVLGLDEDGNLLVRDGDGPVTALALRDAVTLHGD